jgi:4-carboxymuconolactone decarboxylase
MSSERYERGLALLKRVDGEAGERILQNLQDIAPDLGRYVVEFPFGDVYDGALNVGCTREEIVEVIIPMAVYAGFPAALNAMFVAKAVFRERAEESRKAA